MTALIRLRLSGRALSSLGLLIAAVLIGVGGAGWSVPGLSAQGAVHSSDPVLGHAPGGAPSEHALTPATVDPGTGSLPDRTDAGLRPHQIRALVSPLLMTGLAAGSQQYWLVILGLGLYLCAAADGSRLRRLFGGCRNGTRAPPALF